MIPFTKMHGLGNDFVFIDGFAHDVASIDCVWLAKRVCDRKFGIGADGLIIVDRGETAPMRMRMWNPDGSLSEMCGNGIRCAARLAFERGHVPEHQFTCETGAGVLELSVNPDHQVQVNMGQYSVSSASVGYVGEQSEALVEFNIAQEGQVFVATAVSMGNPHLVIFAHIDSDTLAIWGPKLEHHRLFPNRVNIHFATVVNSHEIVQMTWERGAGRTLACGTGACAVAVAAALTGRAEPPVTIHLLGGDLQIDITETRHVLMTGPAEYVFEGVLPN